MMCELLKAPHKPEMNASLLLLNGAFLEHKWWQTLCSHFIPEQCNKWHDRGPDQGTKSHGLYRVCHVSLSPSYWCGILTPVSWLKQTHVHVDTAEPDIHYRASYKEHKREKHRRYRSNRWMTVMWKHLHILDWNTEILALLLVHLIGLERLTCTCCSAQNHKEAKWNQIK